LFRRTSDGILRADNLDSLPWLNHGFGTRLSPDWPPANFLATAKQIHSNTVLLASSAGPQGEGDALVSNRPGVDLAIRTADCLPILVADPKRRAVAAIHAGWRGVVSEIVPMAVDRLTREFGSDPRDLLVAIGPGIGVCCFEVGPEVAAQFQLSGRTHVDLVETTCRQLGRNGVRLGQISAARQCTACDQELFESYRRDKTEAGRMTAVIGILEGA
jgi:polyphenol oxidase